MCTRDIVVILFGKYNLVLCCIVLFCIVPCHSMSYNGLCYIGFHRWVLTMCQACCKFCNSQHSLKSTTVLWGSHYSHFHRWEMRHKDAKKVAKGQISSHVAEFMFKSRWSSSGAYTFNHSVRFLLCFYLYIRPYLFSYPQLFPPPPVSVYFRKFKWMEKRTEQGGIKCRSSVTFGSDRTEPVPRCSRADFTVAIVILPWISKDAWESGQIQGEQLSKKRSKRESGK